MSGDIVFDDKGLMDIVDCRTIGLRDPNGSRKTVDMKADKLTVEDGTSETTIAAGGVTVEQETGSGAERRTFISPGTVQTRSLRSSTQLVMDRLMVGEPGDGDQRDGDQPPHIALEASDQSVRLSDAPGSAIYMHTGSTASSFKMVLGHSPKFKNWGMGYSDQADTFEYRGDGQTVAKIALAPNTGHRMFLKGNLRVDGRVEEVCDIATKRNVEAMEQGLEALNRLQPVVFDRKSTGQRTAGLIAQQVEQVLPEAVAENEAGEKSLALSGVVALLVSAVQELSQEVQRLRSEAQ